MRLKDKVAIVTGGAAGIGKAFKGDGFSADYQFHLIRRGNSWFQMEGMAEPFLSASGDLIVLPHGPAQRLLPY